MSCNILKEHAFLTWSFLQISIKRKCLLLALPASSSSTTFAWQFVQIVYDLFLGSGTTFSWLKDNELKETNRLDAKHEDSIGPLGS